MGFLSSLFSGIKNLFGGVGQAAQGAGKSLAGAGQSLGKAAGGALQTGANFLGGGQGPFSMFSGGGQPGGQPPPQFPAMSMPSQLSGVAGPATSSASIPGFNNASSPDKKKGFLDSLFPGGKEAGIAGLAIPAIGNMFAPKTPKIPDMSSLSSVQALQNFKPGNSVSPEYQTMIQNNVKQLRDQKVRELQALYHNARPGTDYLTDTNYQRDLANLDQGIQDNLTDELAKAEGTFSQQEQERLSQIAQMDIYSIMAQTGLDAQEANDFKQMFSNVGNMFLTNATKKPDNYSALMGLFK